ncbi:uncharacterized protein LOC117596623 isoform X1 [Pangasianodon hypophthalmus]|uniref:uncharacterized protein LOC117596623 isoform X1 n=1 Tax=Pangasianodon hypophthalmus TaxID=310915 RepID=UPI002306F4A0|nr:uncharacterized protein LOC117596623 isoform X1 [Pangasianodon hypophthalmus]
MQTCFYLLIFLHIAEGCKLLDNTQVFITASSGESVVLSCSCADPQDRALNLTWGFRKKDTINFDAIYPSDEINRYRGRVQLLTDDAPGNFTILISHLTAEDGGEYQCREKNQISNLRLVFLTVEAPLVLSTTTASTARPNDKHSTHCLTSGTRDVLSKTRASVTKPNNKHSTLHLISATREVRPEPLPFVPFAVVTVIFLHIIVAVVYCSTRKKDPARVHYSTADGDGSVNLQCRSSTQEQRNCICVNL